MRIGTVVGNLVSTVKEESLRGMKLLVIKLADDDSYIVAVDATHVAGYGDTVSVMTSKEGSDIMQAGRLPVDAAAAGITDLENPSYYNDLR